MSNRAQLSSMVLPQIDFTAGSLGSLGCSSPFVGLIRRLETRMNNAKCQVTVELTYPHTNNQDFESNLEIDTAFPGKSFVRASFSLDGLVSKPLVYYSTRRGHPLQAAVGLELI